MIGKITRGDSFHGLFTYLLKPEKNAVIIDSDAFGETPCELAREFELLCHLNPHVVRKVTHVSIAFAKEDGHVPVETKVRVGKKVVDELGYGNSSYVLIEHGRVDPGHRHEHSHDHCHLVLSNVDLDGKRVDVWWDFPRLEKTLRQIEKEEGFRQVPSSWEVKRSAPTSGQRQRYDREMADKGESALPVSDRLQASIYEAATSSTTVSEFAQRLAHQGIESRLNITRTGKLRGISYEMEGVKFQGSQLYDASLPKLQSVHGLALKSDDLWKLRQGKEFLLSLPSPSEPVVLKGERDDDDIVGGSSGELEAALAVVDSAEVEEGDRLALEAEKLGQESVKEVSKQVEKQTKNSTVAKKRRHGMQM